MIGTSGLMLCYGLIGLHARNLQDTHLSLVYGQEAVIPMEYIIPSLRIAQITEMADTDTMNERLVQLLALEEERFIAGIHQKVQKAREKPWHDRHIKSKIFQIRRPSAPLR